MTSDLGTGSGDYMILDPSPIFAIKFKSYRKKLQHRLKLTFQKFFMFKFGPPADLAIVFLVKELKRFQLFLFDALEFQIWLEFKVMV